jgi:hypothetical protein
VLLSLAPAEKGMVCSGLRDQSAFSETLLNTFMESYFFQVGGISALKVK